MFGNCQAHMCFDERTETISIPATFHGNMSTSLVPQASFQLGPSDCHVKHVGERVAQILPDESHFQMLSRQ